MTWKCFTLLFHAICVTGSLLLSAFWLYQFCLNKDISLLEYKEFYETHEDVFPTISLCFTNPFVTDKLNQHGINESFFVSYLGYKGH